jgi:putative transcriptional regulator
MLRVERGLSQAELGRRALTSRQRVNMIEAQETDPHVSLAVRLARALRVEVEDIFDVEA